MRKVEKTIYKFDELSEEAKKKAIENLWDCNVDYDWWDFIYEDANNVGLKITGFDLDRGDNVDIEFVDTAKDTAESILKEHGEQTETYLLAKSFLERFIIEESEEEKYSTLYQDITPENEKEEILESKYADKMNNAQDEMENLSEDFLEDLSNLYLTMLKEEYEYKTSEEAIIESIEANEWEFTEDGKMY